METLQAIFSRRSIRRFQQQPLAGTQLRKIVQAGVSAATAGNRQPWRFIIVDEPGLVDKTTDTLGWLAGEPPRDLRPAAHIVVLLPDGSSWSAQADAAAAIQNMLVAATDLGIGSCWCGSIKREDLAKLLGIPEEWHVYSVAALGLPAESPQVAGAGKTKVTRDADGRLHVPKKPLDSVLGMNGF